MVDLVLPCFKRLPMAFVMIADGLARVRLKSRRPVDENKVGDPVPNRTVRTD
jgi:hypothetical protein